MALLLSRLFHLQKNTLLQKHKSVNGITNNKELLKVHNNCNKDIFYKCNIINYHSIKKHISTSIIKTRSIQFHNFSNSFHYIYNPLIKLNTRSDILKKKSFQNSLVPNGVNFHYSYFKTKKPKNMIVWNYCLFKNYSGKNGKNEKKNIEEELKYLLLCSKIKKKDSIKGTDNDIPKDKTKKKASCKPEESYCKKSKSKCSSENLKKKSEEIQKQPKEDLTKKKASCKPEESYCKKSKSKCSSENLKKKPEEIQKQPKVDLTKKKASCKPEESYCKKSKSKCSSENLKKKPEEIQKQPKEDLTKKEASCKPKESTFEKFLKYITGIKIKCKVSEKDSTCKKPKKDETCKEKPKEYEICKIELKPEKKYKATGDNEKKEACLKTDPSKKNEKPDCKKMDKKEHGEIIFNISSSCETNKRDPLKDTCTKTTNNNNKNKIKQCGKCVPEKKKEQSQKDGEKMVCSATIDMSTPCDEKKVSTKESKKCHDVKTVTSCDKQKDTTDVNTCKSSISQEKMKEDSSKKPSKRKRPCLKCELVEVDLSKFHEEAPKPLRPPLPKHKKTNASKNKKNNSPRCQYNMKIKRCRGPKCKKKSHVQPKSPRPPKPHTPNGKGSGKN